MQESIWVIHVVAMGPGDKGNQCKHADARDAYCDQVNGLW